MQAVRKLLPPNTLEMRQNALAHAQRAAVAVGVTAVVDFGNFYPGGGTDGPWDDLRDVYLWADGEGKMRVRTHVVTPLMSWKRTAVSRGGARQVARRGCISGALARRRC